MECMLCLGAYSFCSARGLVVLLRTLTIHRMRRSVPCLLRNIPKVQMHGFPNRALIQAESKRRFSTVPLRGKYRNGGKTTRED